MADIQTAIHDSIARIERGEPLADIARALAGAGAVLIPCGQNKIPKIAAWEKQACTNETDIARWHAAWPDMLLGLPCGANGVFVIDLDRPKIEGDPDGHDNFAEICKPHDYDWLSHTLCAETGSGGTHIFYLMPRGHELRNTGGRLARNIDTRGAGGFVVIAPSRSERGQYRWLNRNQIAEIPGWLLAMLLELKEPKGQAQIPPKPAPSKTHLNGPYLNERERAAYQAAFDAESDSVANAPQGERNVRLNAAAFNLGRYVSSGKMDENVVQDALYSAAMTCGLPEAEALRTIRSGLDSGKRDPKEIQPHGGSWEDERPADKGVPNASGANSAPSQTPKNQQGTQNRQDEPGPPMTLERYFAETNAHSLYDAFMDAALEYASSSAIPTGFRNLDALLDGGFAAGLTIIGAITSAGKTSLALQIADNIAAGGKDVLIFSLEMGKFELMAKTLSRLSMLRKIRAGKPAWQAMTTKTILSGKWIQDDSRKETQEVYQLLDAYIEQARRLFFQEGNFAMDIELVRRRIEQHINLTGNKPVVILDYLQILAPLDLRATDKQNIDRSVVELKRISRDFKIPVIAISSFNRENYTTKASLAAFKESGAIEYCADILIGLQFSGLENNVKPEEIQEAKKRNPREIDLLVLKNRHGELGEAKLRYYPAHNLFEEA